MLTRLFAIASLLAALSAGAYSNNYWQAYEGDWNGDYTDVRHWSLGHLPSSDPEEHAVIKNLSGSEITINVNARLGEGGVPIPAMLQIGQEAGLDYSPVRLVGNGRIVQTDSSMGVAANASLYITDNVEIEITGGISAAANRRFLLTDNAKLTVGDAFHLGDYGSLVVSNGTLKIDSFYHPTSMPCTFCVAGGEVDFRTVNGGLGFSSDATVEFTGGNIVQRVGYLSDPRLFPPVGSEFNHYADGAYAIQMLSAFTNELGGALSATGSWFRVDAPYSNSVVHGQGVLSVSTLYLSGNSSLVFDLPRLNLSSLFYLSGGSQLTFPRDVTIGTFGNYYNYSAQPLISYLGCVTAETTDCFDDVTPRSVILPAGYQPIPGSAIRVIGPGSAKFYFAKALDSYPGLRDLEVCAGATTGPSSDTGIGVLRVGRLALHENAALALKASVTSFDSAAPVVFGQGAQVTVSAAGLATGDSSTSSYVHPVVVAGSGDGIPLDSVTVTDNSGSWQAKKVGPAVYLRNNAAYLATKEPYLWTGAVNGDWDNPGNWQSNAVPGSANRAYFLICDTTNVVTVPQAGVTVVSVSGAGYTSKAEWRHSSEPYIFRGGKMKMSANGTGYSAAFYDRDKMPKYFECDVELTDATPVVAPYRSVSFLGGFSAKNLRIYGGELRFGGTATVTNVQFLARYQTSMRYSMITVLPGGSFTTLNENYTVATNGHIHVLGGGTMTLNGTKFAYSGAPVNTNVVDGTLAINAPYSIDTDQCFVGTGRVDIASTYSGANVAHQEICGGVRLNLGPGFRTVTSANAAGAVAVSVPDFREATLGFKGDVTYGPADGVTPSTTSEERALRIGYRASLTLDTSDPDTGAARTVTFKEPILGGGDLTITGSGKVVLEATGSRVGRLALSGGTFTYGGEISGWTELLTADSIDGLDEHGDANLRFRQSANPDGTVRLLVGENQGLMLILR